MSRPTGLTALLTLGFLAGRVVAVPAPEPRAPSSVSFASYRYLLGPSERLEGYLG